MGVPGLWDVINPAGQPRSLLNLAVKEGFDANKSGKRAYLIGIDVSIWYKHASFAKGGENPALRLLFFRAKALAELPLLPLFVFDGEERPKIKRGKKAGKSGSHPLTESFKKMLDAFGMEWRLAHGEAEAELAYLNSKGYIDAILTDDCDAFLFGATTLIKNSGLELPGNRANPATNAEGKTSKHHIIVYHAASIKSHENIALTRGGMILFALLSGGDYDKGVPNMGKAIAHALGRCDFGDQLLHAYKREKPAEFPNFLRRWRFSINLELQSNSRGFLRHRVALVLPETFPNLEVLKCYLDPPTSERRSTSVQLRDQGQLDLGAIAAFCEEKFGDWGYKSTILKRFRTLLWPAAVMHILRRAALEADERERTRRENAGIEDRNIRGPLQPSRSTAVGTPATLIRKFLVQVPKRERARDAFVNKGSQPHTVNIPDLHPLILGIVNTRRHVSTDYLLEYRVEICPIQLAGYTLAGIKGTRGEPSTPIHDPESDPESSPVKTSKKRGLPDDTLRLWIPATMMHQVHPGMVEDFALLNEQRQPRPSSTRTQNTESMGASTVSQEPPQEPPSSHTEAPRLTRRQKGKAKALEPIDDPFLDAPPADDVPPPSTTPTTGSNIDLSLAPSTNRPLDSWFMCPTNELAQGHRGFLFSFPDPDLPGEIEEEDHEQSPERAETPLGGPWNSLPSFLALEAAQNARLAKERQAPGASQPSESSRTLSQPNQPSQRPVQPKPTQSNTNQPHRTGQSGQAVRGSQPSQSQPSQTRQGSGLYQPPRNAAVTRVEDEDMEEFDEPPPPPPRFAALVDEILGTSKRKVEARRRAKRKAAGLEPRRKPNKAIGNGVGAESGGGNGASALKKRKTMGGGAMSASSRQATPPLRTATALSNVRTYSILSLADDDDHGGGEESLGRSRRTPPLPVQPSVGLARNYSILSIADDEEELPRSVLPPVKRSAALTRNYSILSLADDEEDLPRSVLPPRAFHRPPPFEGGSSQDSMLDGGFIDLT